MTANSRRIVLRAAHRSGPAGETVFAGQAVEIQIADVTIPVAALIDLAEIIEDSAETLRDGMPIERGSDLGGAILSLAKTLGAMR